MMTRRFFFTAATAVGMTLLMPLVSSRARAWANDEDRRRSEDDRRRSDDEERRRREDEDEDRNKITICENGHTEQVTRRELAHEVNVEHATIGRCRASRED